MYLRKFYILYNNSAENVKKIYLITILKKLKYVIHGTPLSLFKLEIIHIFVNKY